MPFGIDVFRYIDSFGQRVVVGLSWDVLLLFAFLASLVFLGHFVIRELLNPTEHTVDPDEPSKEAVEDSLQRQGIREIDRFTVAQRASHWIMAISVFALMLSGFIIMNNDVTLQPLPGLSWLLVHQVASVVLIGYVVFHVAHVAYKGTWGEMWFGRRDLKDQWVRFKNLLGLTDRYPRQFKYPSAQKLLHWGVTGATLGLIATGLVLLRRVNVPYLWEETREFTVLGIQFGLGSEGQIGLVGWSFVLHDFLAVATLALVMGHIYFALRPNEWEVTQSMITGKVSVREYAEKYSPRSWTVGGLPKGDGGEAEDPDREE